jgi:hypothetical protein
MQKFITFFFFYLAFNILSCFAQTYSTGFDNSIDQNSWTEYRLGGTSSSDWTFNNFLNVSPPSSLYHDYPMGGSGVEDWFVSPKLYFTNNTSHITIYSRILAMSTPPDIYYGVWISYNSKNPTSGDYVELADLTLFPSVQSTFTDTILNVTLQANAGYIAFKYRANNNAWLMLWLDNIIVDSASVTPVTISQNCYNNHKLSISPNPSHGIFTVTGDNLNSIKVLNYTGQVIYETKTKSKKQMIDLTGIAKGIYFIKVVSENEIMTKKLIIE